MIIHPNPTKNSLKYFRESISAFGLSIILHGAAFIFVGSYVIYEGVLQKEAFLEVSGANNLEDIEVMPAPPEKPVETLPDMPVTEDLTVSKDAPQYSDQGSPDIIISSAVSSSFNLPSVGGLSPQTSLSKANLGGGTGARGASGTNTGIRSLATLFGNKGENPSELSGTFYDLKQSRDRGTTPLTGKPGESMNAPENGDYRHVIAEFLADDWNSKYLNKFYQVPDKLSTTQIFIPSMRAEGAPQAFQADATVQPKRWVIHYQGQFIAPKSTTFRFVGGADDILAVRFNKKTVLDGSLFKPCFRGVTRETIGKSGAIPTLVAGGWITIEEGKAYPLEILLGEAPGGFFSAFLLVQEQNVTYTQKRSDGVPVLPLFQVVPTQLPKFTPERGAPTLPKEQFAGLNQ